MKYQAILFDLDGTLLPQDLQEVLGAVLEEEVNVLSFLGKSHEELAEALTAAFWALLRNDGKKTNEERYFETLTERLSVSEDVVRPPLERFLNEDFGKIRPYVGENPLAVEAYRQSRAHAQKVAVATNPVFPAGPQRFRLKWVGLDYDAFDLVTSYEADRAVKPSREYYLFVCERLGVDPKNCLMIGNDESDDMYGAALVGMDSFLVTDCLIESEKHPYSGKRGTFKELVDYLSSLEVW